MAKKQKGDKYKCEECGVVVIVDEPCVCESCDLVCCDVPMVRMTTKINVRKKTQSKK